MSILMSLMLLFSGMKPTEASWGLIQKGKASFYAKRFQGRKTAYGERIKVGDLTAAHLTLPLNTMVEVTNLANKRSVIVRINDRGPHGKGRIIDLAYSAAKKLGMLRTGTANVAIRVLNKSGAILSQAKPEALSTAPLVPAFEQFNNN